MRSVCGSRAEMDVSDAVSCALCLRSEETETTGALSTKDEVTAHQNCLLFSSGLYCRDSPKFDDLFGFTVEDVLEEVKRGSKLSCHKCKKKGATAGCENKRCMKSYHYPCAVQDAAHTVEDADQGKYGLYCSNHHQLTQRHTVSVNGGPSSVTKSLTSKSVSEAGPSKVCCLTCKKTEGNISLDSLSHSVVMLYCQKHAPASHQSPSGERKAARRLSVCSSDSNSCSRAPSSSKRKLNFRHKQEGSAPKRKAYNVIDDVTDDSSNSDESEPEPDMAIFAPVDTDFDESANSVPETQLISKDSESPTGSTSGNQAGDGSVHGNDDRDETFIHSDAESESLLLPVSRSPSAATADVSTWTLSPCVVVLKTDPQSSGQDSSPDESPVHSPAEASAAPPPSPYPPPPSPYRSPPVPYRSPPVPYRSPPRTSSDISPAPPVNISLLLAPPPPLAPPSDREPSLHSSSFWKSCNAAGCTQALFTGFINEMNAISSRIQSDRASQEDYDHALTVMTASGKLPELVAEQQEELQRKQRELLKASAAMKEVVSALKTRVHQQMD